MKYTQTHNTYIIKIEKEEEVFDTLITFCKKENIANAHFSGIGAVEHISCGYYALSEKQYHFKQYDGLYEVASMTGNVTQKDGEPMLHVHAVFTDEENQAFGGHVESMRVGVVLEVIVEVLDTNIERELDEVIGLFLMNCPNSH